MELPQHGLLEELLAPRRDSWNNFPDFSNGWIFESLEDSQAFSAPNPSFVGLTAPPDPSFSCPLSGLYPFLDNFSSLPENVDSSYDNNCTPPGPLQEEQPEGEYGFFGNFDLYGLEERTNECKVEVELEPNTNFPEFNTELCSGDKKIRAKKVEGQPSKNLMAERRRRKRLNDRLLMLRSIVPKISKMDRTAILGDTIDYMKELLEKVKSLREEDIEAGVNQCDLVGKRNQFDFKPSEQLVRNSPKFDVERTSTNTRIEISCATKPGLLLSTVNTLEALGLDIQQCVISCFNDFSLQASCSEGEEQRTLISSEDIKQALYRNAGYGGRCL
ncbi:hypothetical protein NMG60_11006078 [Bertholletia excelsa]